MGLWSYLDISTMFSVPPPSSPLFQGLDHRRRRQLLKQPSMVSNWSPLPASRSPTPPSCDGQKHNKSDGSCVSFLTRPIHTALPPPPLYPSTYLSLHPSLPSLIHAYPTHPQPLCSSVTLPHPFIHPSLYPHLPLFFIPTSIHPCIPSALSPSIYPYPSLYHSSSPSILQPPSVPRSSLTLSIHPPI